MPEQYRDPAKIRTWQKQAAAVLLSFLEQDLPPATWTITDALFATRAGKLDGQVGSPKDTNENLRAQLDAWSAHLGAPVVWSPLYVNSTTLNGQVNVEVDGVLVEVWTHVKAPTGGAV